MASKDPLIVIVGPTASGKSALGLELAKQFDGEIICADSRTVYKGMDIGTAKPSRAEQETAQHHLLDVVALDQPFNASDFKRLANQAISEIHSRGRVPLLVGGSGLYIDSLLYDYQFTDADAPRDSTNPRHVSAEAEKKKSDLRADTLIIGLSVEKSELLERITARVEKMVSEGFIDEVKRLYAAHPNSKALQAPGYKAFSRYIEGHIKLEEAKELFIRNDIQLAKRQMTWFKRNKSIHWVDKQSDAVDLATTFLFKYR